MRIRCLAFALCGVVSSALPGRGAATPLITIKLAPEIHSEDVNIAYYLYGEFGAAGATSTPVQNVHSYEIKPLYEGKLASSIKGVIYASGCEFDTFEADISGDEAIEKSYQCIALPSVSLAGHIVQNRAFRNKNLEVVVVYLGYWECTFFELPDCQVPQIQLVRAPVDENGDFEATFTDFSPEQDAGLDRRAELRLTLRDAKTWNHIGVGLRPTKDLQTASVADL
jgi:hypothetical protein